jgi:hypothetical protein
MKHNILIATLFLLGGVATAQAQTDAGTIQRDVNQQNRIEQGLKNGSLNTREAGKLEREEARIDQQQARDLKNGPLTAKERAQLRREQNQASRDINRLENNGARGDPNSASSKRMQADVQRNANQEQRIENGVRNGQLNNRQAGRLEAGQARVDRAEARAAKNGHISAEEQERIQERENHQSNRIHSMKK